MGRVGQRTSDAAEFVQRFQTFWLAPTVDGLDRLLAADVVLVQPLARRLSGLASAKQEFARIFQLVPDLCGVVDRWSARDGSVFIEFRMRGKLGGRPVEWGVVDRFTLSGDRAVERVSYFDPSPLIWAALRRPSSWPRVFRSGIWRGWL